MSAELKDCPFCGRVIPEDLIDIVYPVGRADDLYCCCCDDCGAEVLGKTPQEAIGNWNKRKEDDLIELIHKDLKMRADEEGVVNISNFIWMRICKYLEKN